MKKFSFKHILSLVGVSLFATCGQPLDRRKAFPIAGATASILEQAQDFDDAQFSISKKFDVSSTFSDNFAKHNGNHSMVLSGIGSFAFAAPGEFIEYEEGFARFTGVLIHKQNPKQAFVLQAMFVNRRSGLKPKQELKVEAYVKNNGPVDTDTWYYYDFQGGTLTGVEELSGTIVEISQRGPAFQVGVGASGKNILFGASGWLSYTMYVFGENLPVDWPSSGTGDFNVDLNLTKELKATESCRVESHPLGAEVICPDGSSHIIKDGADGKDGTDGLNGADGTDGKDGKDGTDGKDVASCTVKDHSAGAEIFCQDGRSEVIRDAIGNNLKFIGGDSCTVVQESNGATILCPDGTSAFVANGTNEISRNDGPQGPTDLTGKDGKDGIDGNSCIVEDHPEGAKITCGDTFQIIRDGDISAPTLSNLEENGNNYDTNVTIVYNHHINKNYYNRRTIQTRTPSYYNPSPTYGYAIPQPIYYRPVMPCGFNYYGW